MGGRNGTRSSTRIRRVSETRAVWGMVVGLTLALLLAACNSGEGTPVERQPVAAEAETGSEARVSDEAAAAASSPAGLYGEPAAATDPDTAEAEVIAVEVPADAADGLGAADSGAESDEVEAERSKPGSNQTDYDLTDILAAGSALRPSILVVLDPGHGGDDAGTIGGGVVERESNLDFALRVEQILIVNGFEVLLTRRDGQRSQLYPHGQAIPELAESRTDLQARVDLANQVGADVYVSIHSNRSPNPFERGVEVWYDPNREHSLSNIRLSARLLQGVIAELQTYGYPVLTRGILNAECHEFSEALGICLPLFVLAPPATLTRARVVAAGVPLDRFAFPAGADRVVTRSTAMPAALVELLFVSNRGDVATLRDNDARQAIARGIARAIMEFVTSDDRERPREAADSALLVG